MADSALISKLTRYVEYGGTLILSSRSGMKDKNGHLWQTMLQQPIWPLIGARVDFYDQLPPDKKGKISMDGQSYFWNVWGDVLVPGEQTETLATHADQYYEGKSAVVRHRMGNGSVYYIGAHSTDGSLEQAVLRKAWQHSGATILQLPDYVFADWRDGYYVAVNYTSQPYRLPLGSNQKLLLGDVELKPGGVAVFR
jgi:beta-galactosidase